MSWQITIELSDSTMDKIIEKETNMSLSEKLKFIFEPEFVVVHIRQHCESCGY